MIKVNNLTKIYRTKEKKPGLLAAVKTLVKDEQIYSLAVDRLTFSIEAGELVGILGPNGAGKTTLLKMLSGLLYPTNGYATVFGHVPWYREEEYKKNITMIMGQKGQLMWDLSAMNSFLWIKEIYGINNKKFNETVDELTSVLGVEKQLDTQIRRLSFGQRMKMEIIASLLHEPKVLYLDEPTIGLDVIAQQNIHSFIKKYNKEKGTTILLTSHNLIDIEKLCDRVIVITQGKIYYDGKLNDLIKRYCKYKIMSIQLSTGELNINELGNKIELIERSGLNYKLHVTRENCHDIASMIWSKYNVVDLNLEDPPISEVIEKIFTEAS